MAALGQCDRGIGGEQNGGKEMGEAAAETLGWRSRKAQGEKPQGFPQRWPGPPAADLCG